MSTQQTYIEWVRNIKDMQGGALGMLVVVLTVAATGIGGWYSYAFLPVGGYPKIVLALPALLVGAAVFFIASAVLWQIRKPQ